MEVQGAGALPTDSPRPLTSTSLPIKQLLRTEAFRSVIPCRWVSGYRRWGSATLRNVGKPSPHDTSVTSQKTLILNNLKSGPYSPIALHNRALTQTAQLIGSDDGRPIPRCPNCRAVKRRTDQGLARATTEDKVGRSSNRGALRKRSLKKLRENLMKPAQIRNTHTHLSAHTDRHTHSQQNHA